MSLHGRLVETAGGRVFVHRTGPRGGTGAEEPLLLVHGYLMSHYYFRQVLPGLAHGREVIAIDLPGSGESDRPPVASYAYDFSAFADTVSEVMTALGVGRASVLGHSLGGGIALTLAVRQPERVTRLILVDAAVYAQPIPWEGKLALAPGIGRFIFKHLYTRHDFVRVQRRDCFRDPSLVTEEFVDYYWERLNRAGARDAAYAVLQTLSQLSDGGSVPARVRAPTCIVWGEEDRAVPLEHGRRLKDDIAGAELRVVPACGHVPFAERPEEFLRQLASFLAPPRLDRASADALPG